MCAQKSYIKPDIDYILPSAFIAAAKEDNTRYDMFCTEIASSEHPAEFHREFLKTPLNLFWTTRKAKEVDVQYYTLYVRYGGVVHKACTPPCTINLCKVRPPEKRQYNANGKSITIPASVSFRGDTAVTCNVNGEKVHDEPLGEMFIVFGEFLQKYNKYIATVEEKVNGGAFESVKVYLPCPVAKKKPDQPELDIRAASSRYVSVKFENIPKFKAQDYHVGELNQYLGGTIKVRKGKQRLCNRADLVGWDHMLLTHNNAHEYITGGTSVVVIKLDFKKAPNGLSSTVVVSSLDMNCKEMLISEADKQAAQVADELFGGDDDDGSEVDSIKSPVVKKSNQDDIMRDVDALLNEHKDKFKSKPKDNPFEE